MKSSTISQKLNLETIMASLKMLNQQSDQSRQQIFQPCIGDDSNWSNNSMKKKSLNKIAINCGETILGQYCRKEVHSEWSQGAEVSEVKQLKQINKKLFQDNKSLILQCIRLRKMMKDSKQQGKESNSIEIQNLEYLNEINRLRIQNLELKIFVKTIPNPHNVGETKLVKQFSELKETLEEMSTKLYQILDKDKINKLSTSNTTTMTSRFEQTQRDRVISNIKVVYEDRIKNLETQLQLQKDEISKLHRYHPPKNP